MQTRAYSASPNIDGDPYCVLKDSEGGLGERDSI